MKAIIKSTGEIATVECRWVTTIGGNDVLRFIDQKTGISYTEHQLAFLFQENNNCEPNYWEKLKHQAAISIYCNYLGRHNWTWSYEDIIFKAHTIVEKLKNSNIEKEQ